MELSRFSAALLAVVFAASCTSRDAADSRPDSARGTSDSAAAAASGHAWFAGVEPVLLFPSHSSDRALVVRADSSLPALDEGALGKPATLVRLDGSTMEAVATITSGSEGCNEAALSPPPATGWGVGVLGAVTPIPIDSVEGIGRADSAMLTRAAFRLASAVPNSPGGRFAGLPFSLVDLWRVRAPGGSVILVATTRRQINQEDSPLQERTFIVAREDSAGSGFVTVHASRSTGAEETVESIDLLAVLILGKSGPLVLVNSHDFGGQTSYSLIEQTPSGDWPVRWVSRRFSC